MNTIERIKKHQSIRKYKNLPIPKKIINEILETAQYASTSGNMQSYSVIVTSDQEIKKKLFVPHMEQSMTLEAPLFWTFCADFNRIKKWMLLSETTFNYDNFMAFMIGAIDAILFSQNVSLAAEEKGLGVCYMGSTLANAHLIAPILKLPKNVIPVCGFAMGYPDENPESRDRLPIEGIVHWDVYNDYSDEDIQRIYRQKNEMFEKRFLKNKSLTKQIEEKSVKNTAQVYSILKYTQEAYKKYSKQLLNLIDGKDFFNN